MSKSPARIYRASHIADGVRTVSRLQQRVLQEAPASSGPLAALQPPGEEQQPEILEGHCLGCGTKRQFQVENEEKMKNGALRKSGKCTGDGCTRTISLFVKGTQDAG